MKNKTVKTLVLCLCAALFLGIVGSVAFAAGNSEKDEEKTETTAKSEGTENETAEITKDETVYVIANAEGAVQKIIVSDWIKNTLGSTSVNDVSSLTDVVNVKGDETYTVGGNGSRVWDAKGNDIYYQGNIDRELPVALKVSYKLDGKVVSPEDLKGKSGRVTIRFDYENKQYETVKIDGKEEKIYVPFAMLTGLILDNDVFRNIEITNGKLISDGSRTIAAGIAFPGLQEDLGIDPEKIKIPDHVEINADAKNFSFGMTVTISTNGIFSNLDPDKLDELSEMTGGLDELTNAMGQLINGSSKLYDGLCTLLDKSKELVDGITKLANGALALKNGEADLDGGVGQLQNGVNALSEGLDTIASNNASLNGGAKQVFETLLATAQTQLTAAGLSVPDMTVDNYASVLDSVIDSLDSEKVYAQALKTVTDAVEAKRGYIKEQVAAAVSAQIKDGVAQAVRTEVENKVTEAVRAEVEAKVTSSVRDEVRSKVTDAVKKEVESQVTAAVRESIAEKVIATAAGMDKAAYEQAVAAGLVDEATRSAINAAIDAQMQTNDIKQATEQNVAAQMASETVTSTIETQTDSQMTTDDVKQAIRQNTEAQMASDTVKSLIASKTDEQMESDEVKAVIAKNVGEKENSDEIKSLIGEKVEEQVQKTIVDTMEGEEVQAKLAGASEGAKQVISLKASLDSYNTFYLGLQSYTSGVSQAASGAKELKSGTEKLKSGSAALSEGANELYNGILTLKNGIPALVDGITQLRDGSLTLSDGMKQFNEEGVQKLVDAVDGNITGLISRVKATVEVSKKYSNFSGISDEMGGQVKFIYRTAEIG